MGKKQFKWKKKSAQVKLPSWGGGKVLCTLPSVVFLVITSKISSLRYLKLALKIAFSLGSCKTKEVLKYSRQLSFISFLYSYISCVQLECFFLIIQWSKCYNECNHALLPYMSAAYCTAMYRCFYTAWFFSYRVCKTIGMIWNVFKPAKDKGTVKQSTG